MDHTAANKSQVWSSQEDWSAISMQSPLFNTPSGRDPSPPYGHPQTPGDGFMPTLACASHVHCHVSPASLFASVGFDPPQAAHQAHAPPPPSARPSFQSPSSLGSFQSINQVSATHSQTSSAPPVASQWIDPTPCRASNESAHADNNVALPIAGLTTRSMILHQRSLLLKQLSELEKLLESLPPEDDVCVKPPLSAPQSPLSAGQSPPCQSEAPHKIEPEWYASSDGGSPPPPPTPLKAAPSDSERGEKPACGGERADDDDDLTEDSACDPADSDGRSPDSSDRGSAFVPSDDGDVSDALSDAGEDLGRRSRGSPRGSPRGPAMSLRSRNKADASPDARTPDAETEWSRLKNVKVHAMKQGQQSRQRVSRRNHCPFCSVAVIKMSRHLQRWHGHKEQVAAALRFPKGSRERQRLWNRLINEGNYAHNRRVLSTGKGQLAARKRPPEPGRAQDFLHCLYCRGLYMKKNVACHMKRCPERRRRKKEGQAGAGKERVETRCALEAAGRTAIGAGLRAVLSQMIYDDATRLIISEPVLLAYGEDMLARHGADDRRREYLRQSLRQMARLVMEAWKRTPLRRLEDFFLPDNFPHVAAAVNVLAGYDPAARTYAAPSLAIKLGYSLQKVCRLVQERALERGDFALAEAAKNFLLVYRKRWAKTVSSDALSVLRGSKRSCGEEAPDARDVRRLHLHAEKVHLLAEEKLGREPAAESYDALARALLARMVLFNRRRSSEVSSLPLAALKSIKKPDAGEPSHLLLSELERGMCRVFSRMEIRSACGRMVPVLLKASFLPSLELLARVREACGVPARNPFLFGRLRALSAYRGSVCVQTLVKEAALRKPEALTSAGVRKRHAAALQLLSLEPAERELVLGPDKRAESLRGDVHPGGARQPAKSVGDLSGTHSTKPAAARRAPKVGSPAGKQKWSDGEVAAVERHMMALIRDHKVPQKLDCLRCLEAEPRALSTRSWKGIKDYVRNRITALKRQGKPPKR
ncbi:uncharacterized protein LOC127602636 isoform X2 [Hippocampus zosterae]|uniref:uncharacterized protein LOC127602636 isoform X2 n=1 Tax=Hippocampus zosterae TaxID=109293 RepID=UPI00223DF02D|nr:uncharacterized protein LOC127602636 isoform X2 [Hippocampus zosterae]